MDIMTWRANGMFWDLHTAQCLHTAHFLILLVRRDLVPVPLSVERLFIIIDSTHLPCYIYHLHQALEMSPNCLHSAHLRLTGLLSYFNTGEIAVWCQKAKECLFVFPSPRMRFTEWVRNSAMQSQTSWTLSLCLPKPLRPRQSDYSPDLPTMPPWRNSAPFSATP